jgi:hypothetical protein
VRDRWIGGAIVVAALAALALQSGVVARAGFIMGDFRAFYCAARVASHGADPYRTEPLRTCETGIGMSRFFEKNRGVAIPAPLPGYAIAALVPLTLLPFAAAATIWTLLLLLAWFACVTTLSRFAGIAWEMALAVFALSLGMLSLPFGEVVPISVACICLSACFAWKGRATAAALAAAGSMIEPHLGLPVCVALACWRPATRLPLAAALLALGALSIATLGVATNVEYFSSVLPAHALSEATRDTQYSLTAILAALGLPQTMAVRAGTLWYVVMLVAGAFVAGPLAKKARNDAFLVCVPPAFAVFGGTFIHVTQIAAAVPAAVLAMNYAKRPYRELALFALVLLAVPWGWSISPALILAPVVPIGYVAWRATNRNLVAGLLAGIGGAILLFGFQELYTIAAPHFGAHLTAPKIDANLPEASWSGYSRGNSSGTLAAWAVRLPTWLGLALLLGLLIRETGSPRWSRAGVATALAVCCTVLPIGAQLYGDRAAGWLGIDARAYYCAATLLREGKNPYAAAPLHACERGTPAPYYRPPARVTVPAPYPPYALALFAPLTALPFADAALVWWTLLALAIVCAACALAAITRLRFATAWAALALAAALTTFSAGNVLPVALAALLLAALAVARKLYVWAAAAAMLAMVEPHVGLPALVALVIALPAMRLPVGIGVVLLAALSVATAGFATTLEYFTAVVPAHALAEVSRDNQYSLSTILAAIGVSDTPAAIAGTLSYAIATAAGVVVALRLAHRYAAPAAIVLVPPAFSLLGGSFVHTAEIAVAVPAALLLVTREQTRSAWPLAALVLLAVPWMMATSVALFLAPLVPVAYLLYAFGGRDRTLALTGTVVAYAIAFALFAAAAGAPHIAAVPHAHPPIDPRLAEASWRDYVLGNTTNNPAMWLLRLPSWIGLLALIASAVFLARRTLRPAPSLEYRLSESSA